jgi:short-subunit dehydrogenase
MQLHGSKVLVTGASSGIGAALAVVLAERGATVGLVARRADRLAAVLAGCSPHTPESRAWPCDLGDVDAACALVGTVGHEWGAIDAIVHNAAIPKRVPVTALSRAQLAETMRVNFDAPAAMTLAALPAMLARGAGLIVNVSSVGGRAGGRNESAYNSSKFALAGWSEAIRIDLEGTGVAVKLVLPGPIESEIWDQPGNAPVLFEVEKVSARECAVGIADAMEDGGFEYYVPPVIPGGLDVKQMIVDKTAHCDRYLAEMAAFTASLLPGAS